jgi:hypothetical protein
MSSAVVSKASLRLRRLLLLLLLLKRLAALNALLEVHPACNAALQDHCSSCTDLCEPPASVIVFDKQSYKQAICIIRVQTGCTHFSQRVAVKSTHAATAATAAHQEVQQQMLLCS